MRIALVHDYLKEYGGAELVLETLSDIFPGAPIFTTLYRPEFFGPHRPRLEQKWGSRVHQSFFKFIPFASKLISPLRLLSPLAFRLFDFQTFDLIISSATGAYFPNALNKKSAKLLCYCHTPPRYLYGLPTARQLTNNKIVRAVVAVINHILRLYDFKYAQNVDHFIANSQSTSDRIWKFYRQKSIIINPPVDIPAPVIASPDITGTKQSHPSKIIKRKTFYLTGGRLARAKRYDIAIQACNKLKVPLKVFGRDFAGFESDLKKISGPTIEFLGEVDQLQKAKLYSQAKAFIFCSDQEDFGIMPVEAMACGCPVIGYNAGGTSETVIDGKTGVLFDELTPSSCAAAIKRLQNLLSRHCEADITSAEAISKSCQSRAKQFSRDVFIAKIKKLTSSF
ncbi:MAG: glycosyltransferase [Candidatus Shapirobacteria bacterium]|jgi:glycosyltransferase involved in cell wall biosynthesis